MGNPRFKLSDMIPNAWFYKLRDMSKSKHQNTKTRKLAPPRKSYYHSTESRLVIHDNYSIPPTKPKPEPPTTSSKKRKTIYMPSPRHNIFLNDENTPDSLDAADIIIDVDRISYSSVNMVSEQELPPKVKTGHVARKSVSRPGGVRLRIRGNHGPSRRTEKSNGGRRSGEKVTGLFYSESLAIVKASVDPESDFRESMLEMIVENNIRASKELEDLLACYLSLNSTQYHGLIIKAFEHIWFSMPSQARF